MNLVVVDQKNYSEYKDFCKSVYDEIASTFSGDQLEPYEDWVYPFDVKGLAALGPPVLQYISEVHVFAFVCQETKEIAAFLTTERYERANCVLMPYIVTRSGFRKQGLAKRLVHAMVTRLSAGRPDVLFLLESDAEHVDEQALPRLRIHSRLGFHQIDGLDLVCPPLKDNLGPCPNMRLLVYTERVAGSSTEPLLSVPSTRIQSFLSEFWAACYAQPQHMPLLNQQLDWLQQQDQLTFIRLKM